jgi:transketolase
MSDVTRDVARRTLLDLARHDRRIYCLDSDMGGLDEFARALPGQYVDVGIAEANLMGIAAGLAAAGKIPFVNTMSTFAATRACEQVKVDIAYNNLPVRILASHAGLSGGTYGPTHHALEDVAVMRALPNMTVVAPTDGAETAAAVRAVAGLPGPVYVRLCRGATPAVHDRAPAVRIGEAIELREGTDVTIAASGGWPVTYALRAAERLAEQGLGTRVLAIHTLKPLDVHAVVRAARETHGLVTVEDHSVIGGLGSAVAETLSERAPAPLVRVGVPDVFCERAGRHEELLQRFGIGPDRLVEAALLLCRGQVAPPGRR